MKTYFRKVLALFFVFIMLCTLFAGCGSTEVHKEYIEVENEVPKVGPYSQMIRSNGMVYLSAQAPFDPTTGEIVDGDINVQTRRILDNFKAELADAGLSLDDAVSVTIYLTDMSLFADMNAVYAEFFTEPYPVRACVEVSALPVDALLTIQMIVADK